MAIVLAGFNFQGPDAGLDALKNINGVYVILGRNPWTGRWEMLDVGGSEYIYSDLANHATVRQWNSEGKKIGICTHYCSKREVKKIVRKLKLWYEIAAESD